MKCKHNVLRIGQGIGCTGVTMPCIFVCRNGEHAPTVDQVCYTHDLGSHINNKSLMHINIQHTIYTCLQQFQTSLNLLLRYRACRGDGNDNYYVNLGCIFTCGFLINQKERGTCTHSRLGPLCPRPRKSHQQHAVNSCIKHYSILGVAISNFSQSLKLILLLRWDGNNMYRLEAYSHNVMWIPN